MTVHGKNDAKTMLTHDTKLVAELQKTFLHSVPCLQQTLFAKHALKVHQACIAKMTFK